MSVFYAVENEQYSGSEAAGRTTEVEGKLMTTLEPSKIARFVKIETSGTLAQVQKAYAQLYPGNSSGLPVVVTEAAWKTS